MSSIPSQLELFHDAKRHLVEAFESQYMKNMLRKHGWNISAVSRSAGISRKHVRTLIRKYDLYPRHEPPVVASCESVFAK